MGAKVFLIGAGPGDPELLTLKAHRVLQSADVVLHDSLVDARILALAADHAELVDVGKRCGAKSTAQSRINKLLVDYAQLGGIVVRLKGGDPMMFGRATEELSALAQANIECTVIPGITTATAAAAALQVSLSRRHIARSVHFLTGHGAEGGLAPHDWVSLAKAGGTLVVYMGGKTIGGLAAHLIEAGMAPDIPAIAVENVSLPGERIIRASLATLPALLGQTKITGPVILLIGAALHDAAAVRPITESLPA